MGASTKIGPVNTVKTTGNVATVLAAPPMTKSYEPPDPPAAGGLPSATAILSVAVLVPLTFNDSSSSTPSLRH